MGLSCQLHALPLYPRHPLVKRPGWPRGRSGCYKDNNLLPLAANRSLAVQLVTLLTELECAPKKLVVARHCQQRMRKTSEELWMSRLPCYQHAWCFVRFLFVNPIIFQWPPPPPERRGGVGGRGWGGF
jgi:hypothetical protein